MNYVRLLIAAALFLGAVCAKVYIPDRVEGPIAAVREMIDRDSFALPLPEEALAWVDLP